jgi:thiol:disulfide interchange protein DsbD
MLVENLIKMKKVINKFVKIILPLLIMTYFSLANANNFLEPDEAFKQKISLSSEQSILLDWKIAKGYSLYKDKLRISLNNDDITVKLILPKATNKFDKNFDKTVEIYHDSLSISIPREALTKNADIRIQYQGCSDDGLCYSPINRRYQFSQGKIQLIADDPTSTDVKNLNTKTSQSTSNAFEVNKEKSPADEVALAQSTLEKGNFAGIMLSFLGFGLLLAFTPCVLPMVPILSSIIVGNVEDSKPKKGFLLSVAYSLGMVVVYTGLGVAAGLAGEGLAATLQKPSVLVFFACILFLLSLSMFDVYQLQMPRFVQDRLNSSSTNMQGGRFLSVFIMGALSALIVGPCVAGPLAGALIYISQSRDIFLGGLALFSMAVGMSVPLLLTGASAGAVLPRAGVWMNAVKYFFGFMLMATAIWMLQSVLSPSAWLALCGIWLVLTAVFLRVFEPISNNTAVLSRFVKAFGVIFLVLGIIEILGAGLGAKDVLRPLEPLVNAKSEQTLLGSNNKLGDKKLKFERVKTLVELKNKLQNTQKHVILDFYADWCTSCIEMEKFTFSDEKIQAKLDNTLLLQVDVTKNTRDDIEIMKTFKVFGPPALLVFDAQGNEMKAARVIGYLSPEKFALHLQNNAI